MSSEHQPVPPTGYAYLRITDQSLRQEIAKWCNDTVDDGLLAVPGQPGSEEYEPRTSADDMHVTVATDIVPTAVESIRKRIDQHCPLQLKLEQLQVQQDEKTRDLLICIGVEGPQQLTALRKDLVAIDGVNCSYADAWHPCVVAARVRNDTASSDRINELRKNVEQHKRIFLERSWEAAELVVVMPPVIAHSGVAETATPEKTVLKLAYKSGI